MTADRKAIALVADKLFTRGKLDLQAEEKTAKAFPFVNGWLALYAGDPTFAQAVIARAATKWQRMKPQNRPTFQIGLMKLVHGVMRDELDEAINKNVLRANQIDPRTWATRRRAFGEATRQRIERKIEDYCENRGCELLICGFDPRGMGHILWVESDDYQDEPTFAAIGSGADLAEAQLSWRASEPADLIISAIYRACEAKAHAEVNAFVGKARFDAFVMVPGKIGVLSDELKAKLQRAVVRGRRAPGLRKYQLGWVSPSSIAPGRVDDAFRYLGSHK